jgi:site-specific recombinase XerD
MTKEQIQERIKTLETEREQVRSTLLAYEGALQDCKYWLEQLEKKDTDG